MSDNRPWWQGKEVGLAVVALLTALGSWVAGYAQSRAAEKAGVTRADYGFDAVRSELDRQSKVTAELAADVRSQREWLVAFLRVQQVSSPMVATSAMPPSVVMRQPGMDAPSRRTLTPLARSVPPLPEVKASPSPPALPRSLDQLVDPEPGQLSRSATAKE